MCMSLKLLKLSKGEELALGAGFLSGFHRGWEAHTWGIIWGELSGLHLLGVTVGWITSSGSSSWNPLCIGENQHCYPVVLVSHACHSAHPLQAASERIWKTAKWAAEAGLAALHLPRESWPLGPLCVYRSQFVWWRESLLSPRLPLVWPWHLPANIGVLLGIKGCRLWVRLV